MRSSRSCCGSGFGRFHGSLPVTLLDEFGRFHGSLPVTLLDETADARLHGAPHVSATPRFGNQCRAPLVGYKVGTFLPFLVSFLILPNRKQICISTLPLTQHSSPLQLTAVLNTHLRCRLGFLGCIGGYRSVLITTCSFAPYSSNWCVLLFDLLCRRPLVDLCLLEETRFPIVHCIKEADN